MNDLQEAEDRVRGALDTVLAGKVDVSGLSASDPTWLNREWSRSY